MGINALGNGSLKHTVGVNNRLRVWFFCWLHVAPVLARKFERSAKPKKRVGLSVFSILPA